MIAYHGKQEVKDFYLERVAAHEAADEIIHGIYWERGKGCAVGCTIHSNSHRAFETELGIPVMLARLEDRLFEGQGNGLSKTFPRRFLEAIKPGADLSVVSWKFLHWILTEHLAHRDDPRVAKQIKACADVLVPVTKGEPVDKAAAIKARKGALAAASYDAAAAASAAAAADAAAAASSYAAGAAAAAADAAAAAASDAAYASYDAVAVAVGASDAAADAAYASYDAAAAAVGASDAASDAAYAARAKCYKEMADKLIELLRQAT